MAMTEERFKELRAQAQAQEKITRFCRMPPDDHLMECLDEIERLKEAKRLLSELANALDKAFISTWQSTAAWQVELDKALKFLGDDNGAS